MPTISVIIPAYNEEEYLPACLKAVKNQKNCSDFEVIVVDNASTDNTYSVAKKMGVKVVSEKKKGVAHARKRGVKEAKGDILVFTDADAQPLPNWLAMLEHELDEHNLVAVSGVFQFYDRTWVERQFSKLMIVLTWFYVWMTSRGRWFLNCANLAVRRDVFEKVGGFNSELSFGEDIDLSRRLWKEGRIKLHLNIKIPASARRYQWDWGTWIYVANFFTMTLFGRLWKNELADLREYASARERVRRSFWMSKLK